MAPARRRQPRPSAERDFSIEKILFEACCNLKTLGVPSENDDEDDIKMKAEKMRKIIERMNKSLPYHTVIEKLFGKLSCGRVKETIHCLLEKDTKGTLSLWARMDPEEKLAACSRLEKLFREVHEYEETWEAMLTGRRGLQYQMFHEIRRLVAEKYQLHLYVELEYEANSPNGPKCLEQQPPANIVIEDREKGTSYFIDLKNRVIESNAGKGGRPEPYPSGGECYQVIVSAHHVDLQCECFADAELVRDVHVRKRVHNHSDKTSLVKFAKIVKVN